MKDVLRMGVEQIHAHLREVCVGKNRRACLEELAPTEPPMLPPSDDNPCCCHQSCVCRMACQFGIHECQCSKRRTAPTPYQTTSPPPARPRTNTTGSTLHGVHERPRRQDGGRKQVFPTDLYRESYQRYPRFTPSSPEQEASISPPPATTKPPEATPRPVGRRLVSAGGDLKVDERPLLSATLPEPPEGGLTLSAAQYAALPLPQRSSPPQGEAKAPRRPSWVKKIFSRKNSASE